MHVALTLSLKSVGWVEGGPNAFLDAIIDVIGPKGTLMMNTYTHVFPLSEIDPKYVFDSETSIPWTGKVPTALIKRKMAIRSKHPVCSVVALGKYAKFLTEGHDINAPNEHLPYSRLAEIDGYYLCVGIEDRFVAIRHEAQRRAGLFIVPKFSGVLFKNQRGEIQPYVMRNPPCTITQPQLLPMLVADGVVKKGYIGNAPSTFSPAKELIEAMASLYRNDPTLNLCRNIFCLDCRELERRLDLYDRIRNPLIFQRNLAARKIIELRNRLILRRYTQFCIRVSRQSNLLSLGLWAERGIPEFAGRVLRSFRRKQSKNVKNRIVTHTATSIG